MGEKQKRETGNALFSVVRGAALFLGGTSISKILKFVLNLVLTNTLGATLFGIYSYGRSVNRILITLAQLGTGKSLLKFIPEKKADQARTNWVVALAYFTGLAASVLFGTLIYIYSPIITKATLEAPLLTDVLRIFALVLPFQTVLLLINETFRALEKLEYRIAIRDILKPIIHIITISVAFFLGYSLLGAVVALAVSTVLLFSIAITILNTNTDIEIFGDKSSGSKTEFYNFSLPLVAKDVGRILYTRIDILMVGLFLSSATVGIYRVSILLATVLSLPLGAVNQLFPPIASDLYSNNQINEFKSVYETTTRWVITLIIPPMIVLILYVEEVLLLFGEGFTEGAIVLQLFVVAQFTNSAVGPSGYALTMTEHQYLNMINQISLGVTNAILNYFFILEFGFIGAAVATSGTLTVINIARVLEVNYYEGISPYSKKLIKPAISGVLTFISLFFIKSFFTGYLLLAIGTVSGVIIFLATLLLQGIEERDREFFNKYVMDVI